MAAVLILDRMTSQDYRFTRKSSALNLFTENVDTD